MRWRKITKPKLIIYPQWRTSDLHRRRSAFHFGWLIDLRAATAEEKEVTDRRPKGEKNLNRKSEGFTLQRLNHFGSHNDGRRKITGKRSKDQYASAIGTLHASGGDMIWEPQRREKKDYGFRSNKIDARSIEKLSA